LAQRLARFGAPDAAGRLREGRSLRLEDKPVVREVLGRWLRSVGPDQFASELVELHRQLGNDMERSWMIEARTGHAWR
jgi:hypothetical protein